MPVGVPVGVPALEPSTIGNGSPEVSAYESTTTGSKAQNNPSWKSAPSRARTVTDAWNLFASECCSGVQFAVSATPFSLRLISCGMADTFNLTAYGYSFKIWNHHI